MLRVRRAAIVAATLIAAAASASCNARPRHKAPEDLTLHEELIQIPATIHGRVYRLQATMFRPATAGRFPLLVINHGSNPGGDQPRYVPLSECAEFVREGYAVVLPMRRGYAGSEGERVLGRGDDLTAYGLENALDVHASIEWLRSQDFVRADRIFVIGQSTGGLATMAYLSMADPGVRGGINFHGGVRPQDLSDDPLLNARIEAFATYAKTTRLPSVWLYTANDHSSRPPFIERLHRAYVANGGVAELHQLAAFKSDGHGLFGDPDGMPIWVPIVKAFLDSH